MAEDEGDEEEMSDEEKQRFHEVRIEMKTFLKLLSSTLVDSKVELWIYPRLCARFVVSFSIPPRFHLRTVLTSLARTDPRHI